MVLNGYCMVLRDVTALIVKKKWSFAELFLEVLLESKRQNSEK
jgi:hypothetical protein